MKKAAETVVLQMNAFVLINKPLLRTRGETSFIIVSNIYWIIFSIVGITAIGGNYAVQPTAYTFNFSSNV
ncbi:hypothetical protein P9027_32050 [Bacillus thuringiensis]|uniref:hypothetical protein n=1 Tax=Bacillus thuringiensis TaxID=1428 RepID=UPI002DB5FC04|nr:hypothetical protein [Bacillus thuringiensis]MEC3226538.1 hypothetical protein [Bacillus thuringiensis]MEC3557177.1 hypothetical protein [Bacillus thuringiensis]MED2034546.1 hypothetical protein [Bacillus thuringiensis]